MRVFLYACEQTYGGLHGIEDFCVNVFDDTFSLSDIYNDYVIDMSIELMNQYDIDFSFSGEEDYDSYEEFEQAREEEMLQNVDGYVVAIRDDVDLSIAELNRLALELGAKEFVKKYCNENRGY